MAEERAAVAGSLPVDAVAAGEELHIERGRELVLAPVVERRRQHEIDILGVGVFQRTTGVEVNHRARVVAAVGYRNGQVGGVGFKDDLQRGTTCVGPGR